MNAFISLFLIKGMEKNKEMNLWEKNL